MEPRCARHDAAADTTLREALRQRTFWLLALTFTLYAFAAAALWAHVMPAFASKGLERGEALAVVVWIGPAQVAGPLGLRRGRPRLVAAGAGRRRADAVCRCR